MGNFDKKIEKFIEIFIDQNGYVTVIDGLKNTLMIAIVGLIIGIIIGTIIVTIGASICIYAIIVILNVHVVIFWRRVIIVVIITTHH